MLINLQLELHRKDTDEEAWNAAIVQHKLGGREELAWEAFGNDLHCVLQDKCEDAEAISKVRACKSEGIKAFCALYKWYIGRSGQE